jgi:hypothetical protein
MPWFKVDDGFYSHPKVVELEESPYFAQAVALWVLAGSWCAQHLTEGHLKIRQVRKFGVSLQAADALVQVRLWDRTESGFAFRDWEQYQPTRLEIERLRERTRERVRKFRDRRREGGNDGGNGGGNAVTPEVTNGVSNPGLHPSPTNLRIKISDPVHTAPSTVATPPDIDSGVYTCGDEDEFTAERMAISFQRAYLAARKTSPSMGGRNVGAFHPRVVETAQARKVDPEALFSEALAKYLAQEPTDFSRIAPYANFASQFDRLIEPAEGESDKTRYAKLADELQEELRRRRGVTHNAR